MNQELFEKLVPMVRKSIHRDFRNRFNEHDRDDAVQEALVRLWKDLEAKKITDEKHLYNRARHWGRAYLIDDRRYPTGHTVNSREGIRPKSGDVRREKIKAYIEENGHECTNAEIGRALGYTHESVGHHREAMKSSSSTLRYFKEQTLTVSAEYSDNEDIRHEAEQNVLQDDFAERTAQSAAIRVAVSFLADDVKDVVFRHFWLDEAQRTIGEANGYTQATVMRKLRKAYLQLKPLTSDMHV